MSQGTHNLADGIFCRCRGYVQHLEVISSRSASTLDMSAGVISADVTLRNPATCLHITALSNSASTLDTKLSLTVISLILLNYLIGGLQHILNAEEYNIIIFKKVKKKKLTPI